MRTQLVEVVCISICALGRRKPPVSTRILARGALMDHSRLSSGTYDTAPLILWPIERFLNSL